MHTLGWLAGFQCPALSKTVLKLEYSNRSPGSAELPSPEQTHSYAPVPQEAQGPSRWPQSLCQPFIPGKKVFFLALGLSSHILPFKEWSAGSVASTHSNSLLIQRLQKKKITGASLLFQPSLSPGSHFSQFTPPEFSLTITRQQYPSPQNAQRCNTAISILILLSPHS